MRSAATQIGAVAGVGFSTALTIQRRTFLLISRSTAWAATCQQSTPTGFILRATRSSTRKKGLSKSIPRKTTLGKNRSVSLPSDLLECLKPNGAQQFNQQS